MATKQRKRVNLDDLRPKSARMYIKDPVSNEETEAYMDVIGQDSKAYRQAMAEISRSRTEKTENPTFDELYDYTTKLLVATVIGWNEEVFGEFSNENVRKILEDPELTYIREQLDQFTEQRANFFRHGNNSAPEGSKSQS